jgi:hypothetical protein
MNLTNRLNTDFTSPTKDQKLLLDSAREPAINGDLPLAIKKVSNLLERWNIKSVLIGHSTSAYCYFLAKELKNIHIHYENIPNKESSSNST